MLPAPQTHKQFSVRVTASSSQDAITSWNGTTLHITLKAAAVDNKANTALIKFLSKTLHAPVRIRSGQKSKKKIMQFIEA